jgi:hypothetical protein
MPVKCGKGHQHESVAEVRACYGVPTDLTTREFRPNKYPGNCRLCGGKVEPEAGRVDKIDEKWQTAHLEGKCPKRISPTPAPRKIPPNDRYDAIPVGHYATKSRSGRNDLDFWRVDRPEQGTYAGRTFVKRIVGGKPDLNVSRDQKFAALEAILTEGIKETAQRYGQELGRCSRCNRHLTDAVSREFGKGPECRSKD